MFILRSCREIEGAHHCFCITSVHFCFLSPKREVLKIIQSCFPLFYLLRWRHECKNRKLSEASKAVSSTSIYHSTMHSAAMEDTNVNNIRNAGHFNGLCSDSNNGVRLSGDSVTFPTRSIRFCGYGQYQCVWRMVFFRNIAFICPRSSGICGGINRRAWLSEYRWRRYFGHAPLASNACKNFCTNRAFKNSEQLLLAAKRRISQFDNLSQFREMDAFFLERRPNLRL